MSRCRPPALHNRFITPPVYISCRLITGTGNCFILATFPILCSSTCGLSSLSLTNGRKPRSWVHLTSSTRSPSFLGPSVSFHRSHSLAFASRSRNICFSPFRHPLCVQTSQYDRTSAKIFVNHLLVVRLSGKHSRPLLSRLFQSTYIHRTSSHFRQNYIFQIVHRSLSMSFYSTTPTMDEKLLTGPLKIMLEGQGKDSCPVLNQEQVAKIPPRIYNVITREGIPEDLGDMGMVVRVRNKHHHEALKRALNWITRGATADFLTARKFDVIRREGDRKCSRIPKCEFRNIVLTSTSFFNRESHPIRSSHPRGRRSVHCSEDHAYMPRRRHRTVHLQHRV